MARIRYAVVGLGYIAQVAVLPAFRNAARSSSLVALISGDAAKRRRLGRRYGVENLGDYDEYADLMRSGDIDAVCIALPSSMHLAYTMTAVEAGVHVLCEKPLGVTSRECEKMVAAARRNDVRLMTAYRLHFERANLGALDVIRSGRLGDRYVSSPRSTSRVPRSATSRSADARPDERIPGEIGSRRS